MLKTDIEWPPFRQYTSRTQWEPIGFFSYGFCNASHFDLMLGFFSSSAIQIMAYSFAMFIQQGGRMRLVINDILSEEDKQAIANGVNHYDLKTFDLSNLEELKKTLSQRDRHFFDCLSYLISEDRLQIKVIRPKGGTGISHTKLGKFADFQNKVAFSGSCNFSLTALVDNIEHIAVFCDWDGNTEQKRIENIEDTFENVFSGNDHTVEYLPVDSIITNIKQAFPCKDIIELLEEEKKLTSKTKDLPPLVDYILTRVHRDIEKKLEELQNENLPIKVETKLPEFPYPGGPREYQKEAFINWHANNQKGLFAMATGTGKTITSLNCLLEIYKRFGYFKAIILVPTISLVEQWEKECHKFHFDNIVKVSSRNPKWKEEVEDIKFQEKIQGRKNTLSYIIIATYTSFTKATNFKILSDLPKNKVLLIADEVHNMGANNLKKLLPQIPYMRRIGLSATPDRQFDDSGNKAICKFFGVKYPNKMDMDDDDYENYPYDSNSVQHSKSIEKKKADPEIKYTFEFSMGEAINKDYLCRYYYHPHLVSLTDSEMCEYAELSTKIAKYFNFNTESFINKDPILTALLLKRKRIIHKAANKLPIFKEILQERLEKKGSLKYTLIYVPEGNKPDYDDADIFSDTDIIPDDLETDHLIDIFSKAVCDADPRVTIRKFTAESKDRDAILEGFSKGKIDVLTSMKCLDEGIDVPRSEMAIFCASTGNPRQFIQRRGRILRTHEDKKYAVIHDLIVIPQINQNDATYLMERSILKSELRRVRNFADLSENPSESSMILQEPMFYYGLSMFND